MDLVLLTETIIKEIVDDPESVSVKEFESDEEDTILLEVMVAEAELGKVIGHSGKTISSIKTIVQASASINYNKKVNINVDSY